VPGVRLSGRPCRLPRRRRPGRRRRGACRAGRHGHARRVL